MSTTKRRDLSPRPSLKETHTSYRVYLYGVHAKSENGDHSVKVLSNLELHRENPSLPHIYGGT